MVNLSKGQKVDLSKGNPQLKVLNVGLGWNASCDLDTAVYCLDENNHLVGKVYFSRKTAFNEAVALDKDDVTGGNANPGVPKENCRIVLDSIPANIQSICYGAWVYSGVRNFGQAGDAFMELRDITQNRNATLCTPAYKDAVARSTVLANFTLSEDNAKDEAVYLGKIYRREGEWKVQAVGKGFRSRKAMDTFFDNGGVESTHAPTNRNGSAILGAVSRLFGG